ncbi:MAG: C40 family peptidase [Azoarcus sp.]|jgi:cell wall-associated NlpC family hydrolase|nr:C40 family peptidase [Azoarcus sp.]
MPEYRSGTIPATSGESAHEAGCFPEPYRGIFGLQAKATQILQRWTRLILPILACALLGACSSAPVQYSPASDMLGDDEKYNPFASYFVLEDPAHREEIVVRALNLVGAEYRYGGENPSEGLDCSGLVTYVVEQASKRRLPHHAATIALMTRPIERRELASGDLVFFNTMKRRHSHMGIYIGDNRFIHAPAPGQKIRVDSLKTRYFGERLDGLHTFAPKKPGSSD